jgi:diacylglycerol kinase family enzyme
MRFQIILNREGGTLRTLDLAAFTERLREIVREAGHEVMVSAVDGKDIDLALDEAIGGDCDVVMVGGGDGTVSSAAGKLKGSEKALAILPAGTMNLFARSLGVPLELEAAADALCHGRLREVDVASANGRPFIHQFSVGLHAKLIRLREKEVFRSRFGKIWASTRAAFGAFFRPPRMRVGLTLDSGKERVLATAGIGITNNPFGEGHLPYTDVPDAGVLGIYVTRSRTRSDMIWLALNMLLGRWRSNDQVEMLTAQQVRLRLLARHERFGCAIDGELCELETETTLRTHPGSLKVLVPAGSE